MKIMGVSFYRLNLGDQLQSFAMIIAGEYIYYFSELIFEKFDRPAIRKYKVNFPEYIFGDFDGCSVRKGILNNSLQ